MNISLVVIVAATGIVIAGSVLVGYEARQHQKYADVISAKLVTASVAGPREQCYDETVTRVQQVDQQGTAAAFIGAMVDKAWRRHDSRKNKKLVHLVNRDTAQDADTDLAQQGMTYTVMQQHCETVYDSEQQPAGYDVKYHYGGKAGVVHMDHDPGKHIPVENGELVLNNEDDGNTPDTVSNS